MKKTLTNKGFSLVELMIVVAIIGILAAVAVPNFKRFQAKAKQSEAKTLLSNFYAVAQAAHAEYGAFPGNFVGTGFRPDGRLSYRITAANNGAFTDPTGGSMQNDTACLNTSNACNAQVATYKNWTENANTVLAPPTQTAAAAAHTFLTIASADIGGGNAGNADEWSIDHTKNLVNNQNGLPK